MVAHEMLNLCWNINMYIPGMLGIVSIAFIKSYDVWK